MGAGSHLGTVIDVVGERFVIGRDESCDLVLDDDQASRRHAELQLLDDGRTRLVDLSSTNGTFVDGRRIDGPVVLDGGEELRIGDTVMSLERAPETVIAPTGVLVQVTDGPQAGTTFQLTDDFARIGRAGDCAIVLHDAKVSSRHAELAVLDGGRVEVRDLHARNGTFVNGRRIDGPVELRAGDELRVGDTTLAVAVPMQAPAPPSAPGPSQTTITRFPAFLTVTSGERDGLRTEITAERFLIGRNESCDLMLPDPGVSRQHAILTLKPDGGAVIADLGSRNGTFVNGEAIQNTAELRSGDQVRIATVDVVFEDLAGLGAATSPGLPASGVRQLQPGLSVVAGRPPRLSTEGLADFSGRRPLVVIGLWLVTLAAAIGLVVTLFADVLTSEGQVAGNPESEQGQTLLEDRLRGPRRITETVIVTSPTLRVSDPLFREHVTTLQNDLLALGPDVITRGTSYYDQGDRSLVSRDRRTTVLPMEMAGDFDQAAENVGKVIDVVRKADGHPDFRAVTTGEASVDADFEHLSEEDLKTGEAYGLAAAMVVLVFVFRSVVAAFVPLITALISIGVALGLTTLVGQLFDLSLFVTNMIVGMGLALGIDYSLFVLTRYREERELGREKHAAIVAAGGSSGRAVLFSGLAVVLALVGMLFVPDTVLRSLGAGAILVGMVSVLTALTILPAILGLLGDRVNAGRLPSLRRKDEAREEGESFWARVARLVMRRPVVSLLLSCILLIAAAVPVLDLRTGSSGVSTLPDRLISKQGFVLLERNFPAALGNPAEVVIDGQADSEPVRQAVDRLKSRLSRDRQFGRPAPLEINPEANLAVLTVPVRGDAEGEAATAAVRRLRSEYIPAAFRGVPGNVLVTGTTAFRVDEDDATSGAQPFVFAFVLGLSFVLLTLAFRSIVIPVKAIIMNLLSVGAAYGLLVLVFQKGYGADFLGLTKVDAVESWVPLFLFSVLFGLSMDYHVFLLSRVREHFNRTGDNREAVYWGVSTTARLITGAALIMVTVFGGFAAGDLVMFQQMGFGLAVALLLDATLVRSVLVPASMTLLGRRNWYLPRWLRWLPEIGVEGQGR